MEQKRKGMAVFLDRDGTINRDQGYIRDPRDIHLLPGAAGAIRTLNRRGIPVIVVTNQSGIARGYYGEADLHRVNAELVRQLARRSARIQEIFYCPHHSDFGSRVYRRKCRCRKPGPGMLLKAAKKYGLDLKRCYMIGDKVADVMAGQNAATRTVMLLNGIGRKEWARNREKLEQPPDRVVRDLPAAVRWILREMKGQ